MKLDKKQLLICVFLLLVAFAIRSFKINDFLFFGFEQGRDAFASQDIINLKHFPLVGPTTSIPGIFHGSYYYYVLTIPYFLGSGNPLFAIFFIVFIGSLTTIIGYLFAKDVFGSTRWAIAYAIITIFSFEYILYSRWLSHVPFAVLFSLLAYFMLWKYSKIYNSKYFFLFFLFASLSSLFEMIVLAQFIFVFFLFNIFRVIKVSLKDLILGILISIIVFCPLILFDLRNNFISSKSLINFLARSNTGSNYLDSIMMFFVQTDAQFQRTLVYYNNIYLKLAFLLSVMTGLWFSVKGKKNKNTLFFILWSLMGIPLIIIGPGNTQNYLSIGLAWIFLICFALKGFWDRKIYYAAIFLVIIMVFSWAIGLRDLSANKNIIFTTIQDDLNYKDQKRVLDFVHQDSKGQPYKLIAFTIPYLHPEGWEYLHNYFYSQDSNKDAKILYIIVEKHVASEWSSVWIADLGENQLLNETQFGLILVQKRILMK